MRVTGGILRGLHIDVPPATYQVRPAQDKVRSALFSSIGPYIPGCKFLDLFAGTGSVGIEAWSRGASLVCWVENNPRVAKVLQKNVLTLCQNRNSSHGEIIIQIEDALTFLQKKLVNFQFNVIFAGPPYVTKRKPAQPVQWTEILPEAVAQSKMLAPGGLFILETGISHHVENNEIENKSEDFLKKIKVKIYGGTILTFYTTKD